MTYADSAYNHMRSLDIHTDLLAVAGLIELCFANTLDADGRDYLVYLRNLHLSQQFDSWTGGTSRPGNAPIQGLVWEDNGRIVGNLTIIPLQKSGKPVYLIANVAVHPSHRRRGIARQLTTRALEIIQERNASAAWLQVRDDNPGAYDLYCALGFLERTRRTTWINDDRSRAPDIHVPGVAVQPRTQEDWNRQKIWLEETYPPSITWNMPYRQKRLEPGFWKDVTQFFNGDWSKHWSAVRGNETIGVLSWELSRLAMDNLWLAAPEETEEEAILSLLPVARRFFFTRKLLSLNYPYQRAVDTFQKAGFHLHNTLVWMEVPFWQK